MPVRRPGVALALARYRRGRGRAYSFRPITSFMISVVPP